MLARQKSLGSRSKCKPVAKVSSKPGPVAKVSDLVSQGGARPPTQTTKVFTFGGPGAHGPRTLLQPMLAQERRDMGLPSQMESLTTDTTVTDHDRVNHRKP